MKNYKLKDITDVITCGVAKRPQYVDNGVMFLSSQNVKSDKIILSKYNMISEEDYEKLTKINKPEKGDILYTRVGSFGEAAVVDFDEKFAVYVSLTLIKPKKDLINNRYLMHYLNSPKVKEYAMNNTRGIGVQNLNVDTVRDFDIILPDLKTQKKIVEVLDKAQELIDKRKEQIEVLDALVKSRFIEMFGDPIGNTKGWKTEKMNSVAPTVNYKGNFNEEKVWLLNLDMVESNTGNIIEYNYVNIEELGNSTCTFDTTNVLYSKLRPYLNKVVIPNEKGYATSEMIPLQPIKGILNRQYLTYMLRNKSFVDYISEKVSGAKMPRVIMNDFRNFDVPIPPIELQNQFVDFVNQIDKLKSEMETSLKELEDNFNSLMQKAFKGELF